MCNSLWLSCLDFPLQETMFLKRQQSPAPQSFSRDLEEGGRVTRRRGTMLKTSLIEAQKPTQQKRPRLRELVRKVVTQVRNPTEIVQKTCSDELFILGGCFSRGFSMGSQHPSPDAEKHTKKRLYSSNRNWLVEITSRDAQSACFKDFSTHVMS